MKKLLVLMTTVIIILSLTMITPAEISASDFIFKQKEEKGVNSCKPYTYKSKFN